jgi:hypothetical protein
MRQCPHSPQKRGLPGRTMPPMLQFERTRLPVYRQIVIVINPDIQDSVPAPFEGAGQGGVVLFNVFD